MIFSNVVSRWQVLPAYGAEVTPKRWSDRKWHAHPFRYRWWWKKQSAVRAQLLNPDKTYLWFEEQGWLTWIAVSLFPRYLETYGGMRADIDFELLADMKPSFIHSQWLYCEIWSCNPLSVEKTISPVEERHPDHQSLEPEFASSGTWLLPDFRTWLFEYFQLAEDMGAEPLPILNCGMACRFNSAELVPMEQLNPYVQDALDLVEFANGDENTQWGKMRARIWDTQRLSTWKWLALAMRTGDHNTLSG